jgi:hypothetical protein
MTALEMLDFSRSFLTFTTLDRGNNARIQIEARCTLADSLVGTAEKFVMIAACKAEDTYGSGQLFKQPNYDFSGVFSTTDYAIYRLFASAQDNLPESGPIGQLFAGIEIRETALRAPRVMTDTAGIIQTTLDGFPLYARTTFQTLTGRFSVTLDYPIKTMNVNPERQLFQIDTGPLPFPRIEHSPGKLIDSFVPAFVAFKSLDRAEFILQQPTRLPGITTSVNHFEATHVVDAKTTIFASI